MAVVPLRRAAGRPRNEALGVWVWTKSKRWRRKYRHSATKAAKSERANSRRMGTTSTERSTGRRPRRRRRTPRSTTPRRAPAAGGPAGAGRSSTWSRHGTPVGRPKPRPAAPPVPPSGRAGSSGHSRSARARPALESSRLSYKAWGCTEQSDLYRAGTPDHVRDSGLLGPRPGPRRGVTGPAAWP